MQAQTGKPRNLAWFLAISLLLHGLLLFLTPLAPGDWGWGRTSLGSGGTVQVLIVSAPAASAPAAPQERRASASAAAPKSAPSPRPQAVPQSSPAVNERPAPAPVQALPAAQPKPGPRPEGSGADKTGGEPVLTSATGKSAVSPPAAQPAPKEVRPVAKEPTTNQERGSAGEEEAAEPAAATGEERPAATGRSLFAGVAAAGYPKAATNANLSRAVQVPVLVVVEPSGKVRTVCVGDAPFLRSLDRYTAERLTDFAVAFSRSARFQPQEKAYAVRAAVVFDPGTGADQSRGAVAFQPSEEPVSFDTPGRCP